MIGPEPVPDVCVAEPVDGVLAGEDGAEQGKVRFGDRVEAGVSAAAVADGTAVPVEGGDALPLVAGLGEGLEVARVGSSTDLEAAVHVGDAFAHGAPASVPVDHAQDPEPGRVVDGGLDAQHVGLVVDLDRVAAHAVLDSPPLGAAPGVGGHLGRQGRMELAPEEAQHVLGGERRRGVRERLGTASRAGRVPKATSVATSTWSATQ